MSYNEMVYNPAKVRLQCQECGRKFTRMIGKNAEPKCPKCGSFDVDLAPLERK